MRLRRKLFYQPLESLNLIVSRSSPDLHEEVHPIRPLRGDILRSFVTNRTERTKIDQLVRTAFLLVDDVANMQTGPFRWVIRVRLPCNGTAHLTRITIPIQHHRPNFLRYLTGKCRDWLSCFQQILPRLQVTPVVMS